MSQDQQIEPLQELRETDLLLPDTFHEDSDLLLPINSNSALDRDALHRSEGDCTMPFASANSWRSILHSIHLSPQRAERPSIMSPMQSGNSVRAITWRRK